MSNLNWSAFIHTRTYSVDYRTLTMPDDFTDEKRQWVEDHIAEMQIAIATQALRIPPELLQRVFLSDDKHYVVGILYNLEKLLTEDERKDFAEKYLKEADDKAKDISKDTFRRRIAFVFLAYVIKKTSDMTELPPIPLDLDIFKPLCKYICQTWLETNQIAPKKLPYYNDNPEEYKEQKYPEWLINSNTEEENLPSLNQNHLPKLNVEHRYLALHPSTETDIKNLWTAATLCKQPQTLWIGQLPKNLSPESIIVYSKNDQKRTLLESIFLNIALPNISSHQVFSKGGELIFLPPSPPPPPPSINKPIGIGVIDFIVGELQRVTELMNVFAPKSDLSELKDDIEKISRRVGEVEINLSEVSEFKEQIKNLKETVEKIESKVQEAEANLSEVSEIKESLEKVEEKIKKLGADYNV
jgi:Protein of unknown function (DUF2730)